MIVKTVVCGIFTSPIVASLVVLSAFEVKLNRVLPLYGVMVK